MFTASAQTITFSPQGAEALRQFTGKRISGEQLVGVLVKAPLDRPVQVSGGDIFQAASAAGFAWRTPDVAKYNLSRTAQFNKRTVWIHILQTLSSTAVSALTSGLISVPMEYQAGPAIGHSLVDQTIPFIRFRVPDPSRLLEKLFDTDTVTLSPGQSMVGYIMAAFPGPKDTRLLSINLATPAWFELAQLKLEKHTEDVMLTRFELLMRGQVAGAAWNGPPDMLPAGYAPLTLEQAEKNLKFILTTRGLSLSDQAELLAQAKSIKMSRNKEDYEDANW